MQNAGSYVWRSAFLISDRNAASVFPARVGAASSKLRPPWISGTRGPALS